MIEKIESYKGKVLPVVGRPGMGQESVALEIAIDYRAQNGKSVLIINPVEEERDVRARIVCIRDRFPFFEAKRGTMPDKAHQKKFDDAVAGLDKCGFIIDSTKKPTDIYIHDIACEAEDLGLVVILDYDFIPESPYALFLEMLASKLGVPVIVSALVERKVERRKNKIPKRQDIKSEILKKFDTVLIVYRDGYYNIDDEKFDFLLTQDKCGKLDTIELAYNPYTFKVYKRHKNA